MRDFDALVRRHVEPLRLPPHEEDKIVEEWAVQLEDVYDALQASGLSDDEAWSEVRRQLREAYLVSDRSLDDRAISLTNAPDVRFRRVALIADYLKSALISGCSRDVRGGVRRLFANPGFSATVILTLAVCLGANAAVFTVVHRVLLQPLSVPESDRLVGMGDIYPTITPNDILSNDVPSYFDRLAALTTLEEQGLFTFWFDALTLDGVPEELRGMKVTPSIFRVLRVPPLLGRTFTDAEGERGNDQKIILSYSLWQRAFGGAPDIIGRAVRLTWTGSQYTVVGVMPREFGFFDRGYDGHSGHASGVQFWLPLAFTAEQKSDSARTRYGYFHIGRLKPEATVEQVQAQLDALHAANVKRFPQFRYEELGMYSAVTPLQEALTRSIRGTLYLLWAGATCVLLIGAINLANLTLARTSARRRELATRLALGAARAQIARQLAIEASIPAVLGGVAGIVTGAAILEFVTASGLSNLPNLGDVRLPGATILFVAVVSLGVGLVTGLVPAFAAGVLSIKNGLGDSSRAASSGRFAQSFRRALVITQVALSVMLLVGATLLFTSFRHLLKLDAGFSAAGVVTATIFPPPSRYPTQVSVATLQDRVLERVRSIPGVRAAGITSNIPLSGAESPSSVSAADRAAEDDATVIPSVVIVTPGYFEAVATPLMRGRYFDAGDRVDSMRVAIVDERLATRLWPAESAIGKQVLRGDAGPYTIVGIVRDVRLESLTKSIQSIGTAYFPHTQAPPMRRLRWIAVKSAAEPTRLVRALRLAIAEIDPDLAVADVQTMEERTANSVAPQQLAMSLATMFGAVALLLSMLGVYGVLASLVSRRTREIGIRMALGASVQRIFKLVLAEGAVLIGIGLACGAAGALLVAGMLKSFVFGVEPSDPLLILAVATITGAIALVACVAPALRATHVDPVMVLTEP
jgi:predicted permease